MYKFSWVVCVLNSAPTVEIYMYINQSSQKLSVAYVPSQPNTNTEEHIISGTNEKI